jgi:hypothetical protein
VREGRPGTAWGRRELHARLGEARASVLACSGVSSRLRRALEKKIGGPRHFLGPILSLWRVFEL